MLSGLINSSTVSVDILPVSPTSTIALATVYRLGLLPKFDRFGRYTCDPQLSVPTSSGFYTSRTPLRCSHTLGESDITLGSDWVAVTGSVFCGDGSELLDPPRSAITSLSDGYHWSPNEDRSRSNHSIDVDLVLSILIKCLHDDSANAVSSFFAVHGMDVDDPLLDECDAISHLMNGYCANHTTPACSEVSRELSSEHLKTICSTIGIKPNCHQRQGDSLIQKLKLRCKDLQPLLNCAGLEDIFSAIEGFGARPLRELAVQHQLNLHDTQVAVKLQDLDRVPPFKAIIAITHTVILKHTFFGLPQEKGMSAKRL